MGWRGVGWGSPEQGREIPGKTGALSENLHLGPCHLPEPTSPRPEPARGPQGTSIVTFLPGPEGSLGAGWEDPLGIS